MTQEYLIGQLSVLLGELEPTPADWRGGSVGDLRREIERSPARMFPELARRAMRLVDRACWTALENGHVADFQRYATVAAALGEYVQVAGLHFDPP